MNFAPVIRGLKQTRSTLAFTLIELLVVISIIIALAAIALPSFRGLTESNVSGSAVQQLVDDLSEARLRAINGRGTVYVVFSTPEIARQNWGGLNVPQRKELLKAVKGQYSGYAMFTRRNLGDQPGAVNPRYLSEWRYLPDGVFIATNKFFRLTKTDWENFPQNFDNNAVRPFFHMPIPFPTASNAPVLMPVIAFDYRGQLLSAPAASDAPFRRDEEIIPFTQGSMIFQRDATGGVQVAVAELIENPAGNTTNNSTIRIDPLTGRVRTEAMKGLKP